MPPSSTCMGLQRVCRGLRLASVCSRADWGSCRFNVHSTGNRLRLLEALKVRWKLPLLVAATLCVLTSCGGASPVAPSATATNIVVNGPQVLRIQVRCAQPEQGIVGLVYTRVSVTTSSNEWVATADSAAAGDTQIRLHQLGPVGPGSMPVAGTMSGTAVHLPELLPGSAWDTRVTFTGPASLTGVAFVAGTFYHATDGISGVGEGALMLTSAMGDSCAGSSTFSWSIFPLP